MNREEIVSKVESIIEQLRPYLQDDGGDLELVEITEDFIVKVKLKGACGSCPYSLMTLKNGVEDAIKRNVPEIKEVVGV
ncbi:MAG: NifU family protein [Bacteroidales bacterium]|nr:NifU family protein [Bacteroidales bacterium]